MIAQPFATDSDTALRDRRIGATAICEDGERTELVAWEGDQPVRPAIPDADSRARTYCV